MKNFKKILCLVLALSMVLALAACNNSSDGDKDKDNDQKTEGNEVTGNPEPETFEGDIEFTLPNGEGKVTAVADTEDYVISSTDKMFTIIKSTDDTDCTFAEIIYEEGKKAQDLAPDYIDTYVGTFENYEYPGTIEIGADGLSSEMVIASSDSQYVELYLVDLDSGALAIIVSVAADAKDAEYPVLYNIVDTLKITK